MLQIPAEYSMMKDFGPPWLKTPFQGLGFSRGL